MKKLNTLLVLFFLTGLFLTSEAQDNLLALTSKPLEFVPSEFAEHTALPSTKSISVDARVNRKFSRKFADTKDVMWARAGKGYLVRFTSAGVLTHAFLTRGGAYQSSIRYYPENGLPASISRKIKIAYPHSSIRFVREVRHNGSTTYLVTVADAAKWEVVRVSDGDLDVWEQHSNK